MPPQTEQNIPISEQLPPATPKAPLGIKNLKYKIIILVIFLIFVAGIGYKFLVEPNVESQANFQIISQTGSTQDWKTYTNTQYGFEFKYPEDLEFKEDKTTVTIRHAIPYVNNGDCDMTGDKQTYNTLDDFKVSFEVGDPITPPYSDGTYKAGILDGLFAYEGAEGCGDIVYYFPAPNKKMLVVRRAAVQALSGISTIWDREAILKVPGVITPDESKILFNQILSTLKFTSPQASTRVSKYNWEIPIDLVQCLKGEHRFEAFALGSEDAVVIGKNVNNCSIEYTTEREGGYTKYSCKISVSFSQISPSELETSKYCTVTKTGNLLLENN